MAKIIDFSPDFYAPTRSEAIHGYVERFDARDAASAQHIADEIIDQNQPLAKHLVLIPVAAHQESTQIEPALAQYANQITKQPFTVILGLNSPTTEADNPHILATSAAIDRAKKQHPDLDVRSTMTFYDEPTIGMVRRDLWNGTLLATMSEGAYLNEDEIIGINHDIDVVSINPRYIHRIQEHYTRQQRAHTNAGMQSTPFTPRATLLKHAPSEAHPNTSKGIYWMDFITRQMNSSYEASLVLPFSHYANTGGFNTTSKTYETQHLFEARAGRKSFIPGTTMQTSPRRYIDRLQYGYENIWTDESFGASDTCRTVHNTVDISHGELEDIISRNGHLEQTVASIASAAINQLLLDQRSRFTTVENSDEEELVQVMHEIVSTKIGLIINVLARVIESHTLSTHAIALYCDMPYRDAIINQHFFNAD